MRKLIIATLIFALIPVIASAAVFARTGTAGLQFLKLGVDGRAIGMGEAYTAVANDASAAYWNPAGLALSDNKEFMFSHTNYVADIMHEFFAATYPTDMGTWAISASVLHMDDMDVTTEEVFGPTGETFTCGDLALGLSYANMYTDKFSFGVTAKYLQEDLDEYQVQGFAVDLGSLYNTGWRNLTIGMAMRNFGPDLKYDIDSDGDGLTNEDPFDLLDNDGDGLIDEDREEVEFKIPMHFSLGAAIDLMREDDTSLIASAQLDNYVDRSETWNMGAEYTLSVFSLRGGYKVAEDVEGASFTAGFGFKIPTSFAIFQIDYAYNDMQDLEESFEKSAHRLSLKMSY